MFIFFFFFFFAMLVQLMGSGTLILKPHISQQCPKGWLSKHNTRLKEGDALSYMLKLSMCSFGIYF
uniref:Secreted protein n=1 Tax=Helianthus annuus TaxID=4232 RepID=A0A251TJ48_HELAN